jgi:primosomal protein N' (replication factor Y)
VTRIADVVFDAPVGPFSYLVPDGLSLAPGQRVLAWLGHARRPGLVVALRDGSGRGLKPVIGTLEAGPVMSRTQLDLARWIAAESLSPLGSTCMALLPAADPNEAMTTPPDPPPAVPVMPEILAGAGRAERLVQRLRAHAGGVLVLTADVAGAAEWSDRLSGLAPVVRLDSGVSDGERRHAWAALAAGQARIATGTRGALLAPVPTPAAIALIDEHDAAHKPPGPPRIHAREVVLRRSETEGHRLLLTSGTPSVEMWWRADHGQALLEAGQSGDWPTVTVTDTRGALRSEPLMPPLAHAVGEALGRRQRVCLLVSRLGSALACDDCGAVVRCPACEIAFEYARGDSALGCRQCGRREPAPDTCPSCAGRRLSIFGWGAERVEHAVRRRFPRARVARYDPEAMRGARLERQRAHALGADIVIGTRGALRLFAPESFGAVGFVTPDQLLRRPDFRAGERLLAVLWAAAERTRPGGPLHVQSQHPDHYAFRSVIAQDLAAFYRQELRFRAELGYPPFRRLVRIVTRAASDVAARDLALACTRWLDEAGATVYPPWPDRLRRAWTVVAKGGRDLPARVRAALDGFPGGGPSRRRVLEIEMDPVD